MSTREFFIRQLKAERPAFEKVIRALPDDRLDYKPHERNSTAGEIAWFLVLELRALVKTRSSGKLSRSPGMFSRSPVKDSRLRETIPGPWEAFPSICQRLSPSSSDETSGPLPDRIWRRSFQRSSARQGSSVVEVGSQISCLTGLD